MHQTASRHRVEAAMAGRVDLNEVTSEEGVVFNAEIAAAIEEDLARTDYGEVLASRGITTVALNDDGEIVEYRPDGSPSVMDSED